MTSITLDLSFADDVSAVGTTETVTLNGKEYTAVNLGASKGMQFWQVLDAYEDVKDLPKTVHKLPLRQLPLFGGKRRGVYHRHDFAGWNGGAPLLPCG